MLKTGDAPTVAHIMHRAQLIERLGFDGIWVSDSIGRANWPVPDPLAWLTAAAAAATEHIELPLLRRLCRGERVGSAYLAACQSTTGGPLILVGSWRVGAPRGRAVRRLDRLKLARRGPQRDSFFVASVVMREAGLSAIRALLPRE